jgi:hypothetical protein
MAKHENFARVYSFVAQEVIQIHVSSANCGGGRLIVYPDVYPIDSAGV